MSEITKLDVLGYLQNNPIVVEWLCPECGSTMDEYAQDDNPYFAIWCGCGYRATAESVQIVIDELKEVLNEV